MGLVKQKYRVEIEVSEDEGDLTEEIKECLSDLNVITYDVSRTK